MIKKDFPALTGVRFIAASFVFLSHYADSLALKGDSFTYLFLRQLNVGVNLFFVLSGFLITYRYYENSFSWAGFKLYFKRRVARIFPLYLIILASQFLLMGIQGSKASNSAVVIFLNITLIKGLSEKYLWSGITQSWSLTVEEMFYLFAPFSYYLIRVKKLFWLQIFILIASGFALVLFFLQFPFEGFFQSINFMLSYTFFGRCFEFFVGIFLALKLKNAVASFRIRNITLWGGLLFFVLLLLLTAYAYHCKAIHVDDTFAGIILFNFLLPVAIGIFYFGLLVEETFVKRILSANTFILLGKSSYAFYLLHIGLIAELIYFHITSNILLLYIALQILSILAYKVIEKPFYFLILRKFAP